MRKFESAGGVIINEFNEIVLALNPSPSWQFPKGSVERGESYIETAKREIREETGLKVPDPIKKLPTYTRISSYKGKPMYLGKQVFRTMHYFLFRIKKQKLKPGMEVKECQWVPIEKVESKISYEEDKAFFRSILGDLKS